MQATEQAVAEEVAFRRERQEGVGASSLPSILGASPWKDALDVYHELTRPVDPDDVRAEIESGATPIGIVRGNVLEPRAAEEFFSRTGRKGRHERNRLFRHPDFPHAQAHSDGTQFQEDAPEDAEGSGTLEAKAPRSTKFDRLLEAGLGEYEVLQIQYELAVRRHDWGSFAFYNLESSHGPLHAVDVEFNPDLGGWLLETAERFYREHVEPRNPPDPDEWANLREEEGPPLELPTGDVIELDSPRARSLAEDLAEAKSLKDEGEELYESRREKMGEFLREIGKKGVRVPDVGTFRWIQQGTWTSLDEDKVRDHEPIDRDAFIRWLVDHPEFVGGRPDAEDVADSLALDLDRLSEERGGAQYVGVYL